MSVGEKEALRLLAEAGLELASSLDHNTTLARVARLALPVFADWCQIDLLDGPVGSRKYRTVATAHVDPAKERLIAELRLRYPPDPSRRHGIWHVLDTAESIVIEDASPIQAQDARAPEHLALMRQVGTRSVIRVPLAARDHVLGVLSFGLTRPEGRFDQADLALAKELGRRAAVAVDNARLYGEEQRARVAAEMAVRARDEFLSSAAHELKTPITSLLGGIQLERRRLQRDGIADVQSLDRSLAMFEHQVRRLSRLVHDLLDVSRLERGHLPLAPEEMNLDRLMELVQGVADELQPTTMQRLRVTRTGPAAGVASPTGAAGAADPPPSCTALVDPLRLVQVLINLVDNARRFSPPDGEIHITVACPAAEHAQTLRIGVRDHGVGVPAEQRASLFERFFQAHVGSPGQAGSAAGGMGMGLYLSRQIVDRHGGRIWVEFPEDGGSHFLLELPCSGAGGASRP